MDLLDAMEVAADAIADFAEGKRGLHRKRHTLHYSAGIAAIKEVMAQYFTRQGAAILVAVEPYIVSVSNQFREADEAGKRFAKTLVPVSLQPLRFSASGAEDLAFTAAITGLIEGASATLAEEIGSGETIAPNFAGNYLRENSLSKLTGNLESATVDRLQNAIAEAWDAGGSYDQIVGAIQSTFEDFSDKRAGLIARTEASDAYNEGRAATARTIGLGEKSWETESGNPCPTCVANEEQGWIPVDDAFDSGDDAPTAHPACECVCNFR